VIPVPQKVAAWRCGICGKIYETEELAALCESKGKEHVLYPVGTEVGIFEKEVVVYRDPGPNETVNVLKKFKVAGIEDMGHEVLYRVQDPYRDWVCFLVKKEEIQQLPPLLIVIDPVPEEDGSGWLAQVVDLPGCMSDGKMPAEALKNVMEAKKAWLKTAQKRGLEVPAVDENRLAVEVSALGVSVEGPYESVLEKLKEG
jgi:predicted RNase H-like HicB family nuclease